MGCRRWLETSYQLLKPSSSEPLRDPAELEILDLPLVESCQPGRSTPACGAASFNWLTAAVELVQNGRCRALVTAPIAKASWHAAGHPYPGQTERLAELSGSPEASMLFTALAPAGHWRLNTLLATTHIPLAAVPQHLNAALVQRKLDKLLAFCQRFNPAPHLVVAGLNPHAGEAGQLGQEEQSGGIRLIVRGADGDGVDVAVSIVVPPSHTEIVRGTPVTELHCIANAR